MKNFYRVFSILLLTFLMGFITVIPISAENIKISADNIETLDRYIIVVDNQYVLKLPDSVEISEELLNDVTKSISQTNEQIISEGLYLDPETKSAVQQLNNESMIGARSYGKNKVVWRWNSFTAYLDAGMVRMVSAGAIAAAGQALKLPTWAMIVAAGALGAVGYLAGTIHHGVWVDVNHFGLVGCGIAALGSGGVALAVVALAGLRLGGGKVCGVSAGLQ